jgi:hypothetical protein
MTEISSLDARMANLEAMLDSLVGTVVDSEVMANVHSIRRTVVLIKADQYRSVEETLSCAKPF